MKKSTRRVPQGSQKRTVIPHCKRFLLLVEDSGFGAPDPWDGDMDIPVPQAGRRCGNMPIEEPWQR